MASTSSAIAALSPAEQRADLVLGPPLAGDDVDHVEQSTATGGPEWTGSGPGRRARRLVRGRRRDDGAGQRARRRAAPRSARGRRGVLPVAGIADEGPPRPPRPAARSPGWPLKVRTPAGAVAGQPRSAARSGDACASTASRTSRPPRPMRAGVAAGEHAGQPVVGRDDAGAGVRTEDPLVAVGGDVGPVAVDDGAGAGARPQRRRADVAGDGRAEPVGTDHQRAASTASGRPASSRPSMPATRPRRSGRRPTTVTP